MYKEKERERGNSRKKERKNEGASSNKKKWFKSGFRGGGLAYICMEVSLLYGSEGDQ